MKPRGRREETKVRQEMIVGEERLDGFEKTAEALLRQGEEKRTSMKKGKWMEKMAQATHDQGQWR
jgi:hypothetical protein